MPAPRKKLGQHFLRDHAALSAIVSAICPSDTDYFLELGAGDGALTSYLLDSGASVTAIELDKHLFGILSKRFSGAIHRGQLRLHQGDMRELDWQELTESRPDIRQVGNLPYNISSLVLARTMRSEARWRDAHFLVQKEMAQRVTAVPGGGHWGRLGVLAHCSVQPSLLLELPPEVFSPPPKVRSALLRLQPLSSPLDAELQPRVLYIARHLFAARRKSLRNSLKPLFSGDELRALGLTDLDARAGNLSFEDLCRLAAGLQKQPQD